MKSKSKKKYVVENIKQYKGESAKKDPQFFVKNEEVVAGQVLELDDNDYDTIYLLAKGMIQPKKEEIKVNK